MEELVVVCSDRECRHHHHHRLLNGIRICDKLDILKNVEAKVQSWK